MMRHSRPEAQRNEQVRAPRSFTISQFLCFHGDSERCLYPIDLVGVPGRTHSYSFTAPFFVLGGGGSGCGGLRYAGLRWAARAGPKF